MKRNVGKADAIFRIILGVVIIGIGVYFKTWWGLLGILPIITALIRWCPLYVPLKLSTNKKDTQ